MTKLLRFGTIRLLALIGISILLFCTAGGCAKQTTAPVALKPVTIQFLNSFPSFSGAESVYLLPSFKVNNPNKTAVSVDLSYTLYVKDQVVGSSQLPTFYIPGEKDVTVRDTIPVVFSAWFAGYLLSKVETAGSVSAAIGYVAPLWKGISGKRPAVVPEELWNKIETVEPPISADMSGKVSADGRLEYIHVVLEAAK